MRTLRRFAVVTAVVAGAALSMGRAGADQAVPFQDQNAKGFLALCDQHGDAMTGGKVDATPFVWRAVSSFVPPAPWQGKGQNAALMIYQARQGVDPEEWSGDQLTGASYYADPRLPAAQATYGDISLRTIVSEFPPMWNGLYQLRMMFAKTNYGIYNSTYPATVIQVTGDTWHVVAGGSLPCGKARTVSNETFVGVGKHPKPGTTPLQPVRASGHAATGTSSAAAVTSVGLSPAAARHQPSRSSWAAWTAGIAVALAVAGGAFALLRRRRRTAHSVDSPDPVELARAVATSGRTSAR